MKFGVGQPVLRIEDSRLITGQGRYTDDIEPGTGLGVAFLRAPLAHARLLSVDTSAAAAMDGVLLVATQVDLDADKVGEIQCQQRQTYSLKSSPGIVNRCPSLQRQSLTENSQWA